MGQWAGDGTQARGSHFVRGDDSSNRTLPELERLSPRTRLCLHVAASRAES